MMRICFFICFLTQVTACSITGGIAEASFTSVSKSYSIQPQSIKDSYPDWMKETFFTSELLTTDYDHWQLRILSPALLKDHFIQNTVTVKLEYEIDYVTHNKTVNLIYINPKEILINSDGLYIYDFTFSPDGKEFWNQYHQLLFNMKKPWFTYQISPVIPPSTRQKIDSIKYNYAPNWGFLSLKEFMVLYRLNSDKRWKSFCEYNDYLYDTTDVCGEVYIDD